MRDRFLEIATDLTLAKFCDIELGLYLLFQLAPGAKANSLWVLLTGYPFPIAESQHWSEEQWQMLGNARHILTPYRSEYSWRRALERYRQVEERLRGYEVDEALEQFSRRPVSICSNRYQIYENTLSRPLRHRQDTLRWITQAGIYECVDGKYRATVDIPEELLFPQPLSHDLTGRTERQEIEVPWQELIDTARWMDSLLFPNLIGSQEESQKSQTWEYRISKVNLEVFAKDGVTLSRAETLTLDGLMHLIGMVSSGKSTLMDVLAVWAARKQLHVTIVVGDVIGALKRAELFEQLGIKVAPILGASNRERHTNRLHRAWNAENPLEPFAELVYRRSNLVIVDEADQVQVQADLIFSPNQKLFGRGGDGWFSQVQQPVVRQLNLEGRAQLADPDVDSWCQAHDIAQTATSRIYALILSKKTALQAWSDRGEYFTDWIILDNLAIALSGATSNNRDNHPGYRQLMDLFENYLDDPLGDRRNHHLSELTRQLITVTNEDLVLQRLREWVNQHKAPTRTLTEQELENAVVQLEFALLVAAVQSRLNPMLRDWKLVEGPLKLEGESSLLVHNPPRDYEAVIPAAPMGNVLAFQYVVSSDNKPGDLRFFKCLGVGRWLLLHLHKLFTSDRLVGPHVLLLSGTSWAGKAPGYHIQVPVAGVLRSPDRELQAIKASDFRFDCYYHDEERRLPIVVSGKSGHERAVALKELLNQLAQPGGLGGPSFLEVERASLPKDRQRILLLVGSYQEAKLVQEHLEEIRPEWRNQILRLVCDDDEFESEWRSSDRSIQRGLVHKFADTGAWILIAPLMAIERGHNILNEENKAAFGAAYFLVRPHPRPDDISYAIHSINRWAVDRYADTSWLTHKCKDGLLTLDNVGDAFRDAAYRRWRYLLRLPMIYSTLPDYEREAVIWNQLVSIWQVIGRLVRGGSPARVVFCDAAFARRTAYQDEQKEETITSLLVGIQQVLRPYFLPGSAISNRDKALVQALYEPFYQAMTNMGGIAD